MHIPQEEHWQKASDISSFKVLTFDGWFTHKHWDNESDSKVCVFTICLIYTHVLNVPRDNNFIGLVLWDIFEKPYLVEIFTEVVG